MQAFNDISIQGINKDASIINEKGNSEIHLKLSSHPPGEWTHLFVNAWTHTWYSMKQHAEVSGAEIIILCHHSTLIKEHLPQLERAVATTNDDYRKHYAASQASVKSEMAAKERESKILGDLDEHFKSRGG